jgi:hypothetical protein
VPAANAQRNAKWTIVTYLPFLLPQAGLSHRTRRHRGYSRTIAERVVAADGTMERQNVAMIETGFPGITLVDVYEVEPDNQAELCQLLSNVTEAEIRKQPGFVSVSVHSSAGGGLLTEPAPHREQILGRLRRRIHRIALRKFRKAEELVILPEVNGSNLANSRW